MPNHPPLSLTGRTRALHRSGPVGCLTSFALFADLVPHTRRGAQHVEQLDDKSAQVVSIRGTANIKNAIEDAEYLQSNNKNLGIFVHKGFDEDAYLVYQADQKCPNQHVEGD